MRERHGLDMILAGDDFMTKRRLPLMFLAAALLLAGCAQTGTPSENDQKNTDQTQTNTQENENSNSENGNVDQDQDNAKKTEQSDQTEKEQQDAEAARKADEQSKAKVMLADVEGKLEQALNDAGYTTETPVAETSDTGNEVAIFKAQVAGSDSVIYVTACLPQNPAEKTFDANTTADEANDMSVMDEWSDNGNKVRVVRNNMANGNYIEVLDSKQNVAIHIVNDTPEQLQPMLDALKAIGYPIQ